MKIVPVIIAGGNGTRLWPVSRIDFPKQFLKIFSDRSLLQNTALRVTDDVFEDPIIVCNENQRFLVKKQMDDLKLRFKIILEPEGRNTAAAIAIAANIVKKDSILLVMSSDALIENNKKLNLSIINALDYVDNSLIAFGVKPKSPHIGYGYIQTGEKHKNAFEIEAFKEKPNKQNAIEFIEAGNYFWNIGVFMFRSSVFLKELKKYESEMYFLAQKSCEKVQTDGNFLRVNKDHFLKCKNISIDYAVMEKTEIGMMIELDSLWNDLGSWDQIYEVAPNIDDAGNSIKGNVQHFETKNTLIYAENRLILTIGLEDLIISDTKDALLISRKDKIEKLKDALRVLKEKNYPELECHTKVYRPWGSYECIDSGPSFNVKRLIVSPQSKLSVQKHYKRSEHWIVVEGEAEVRNGDNYFTLKKNESTYIQQEAIHSLKNPSMTDDLHIIEVQTGTYFGEDDIERFEDVYGRLENEK